MYNKIVGKSEEKTLSWLDSKKKEEEKK